jgi:serine phosphatase RsbU (regulator of sigma subunit)
VRFYFTLAAGRFIRRGRRMTFACGYPPSLLVSTENFADQTRRMPFLVALSTPSVRNASRKLKLVSGDRRVLYTDGFIEVFDQRDEMLELKGEELVHNHQESRFQR